MMELGELEFSNAAINGCVSKSCFVSVLYSSDAASNIAVKLAVERSVVGLPVDIGEVRVERGEEWNGHMGWLVVNKHSDEDK